MVERLHRQLNNMFRALCTCSGESWLDNVGLAVHTHNTHTHTALGTSPFSIFFNAPPRGTLMERWEQEFLPDPTIAQGLTVQQWLRAKEKLEVTMNHHNERVKEQLQAHRSRKTPKFVVGDEVWVRSREFFPTEFQRFQPRVMGPFMILEVLPHDTYVLQVAPGSFDPKVHVSRLERFISYTPTVASSGVDFVTGTRPQQRYIDSDYFGPKISDFNVYGKGLLSIVKHGHINTKNFGRVMRYLVRLSEGDSYREQWVPAEVLVTGQGFAHTQFFSYIMKTGSSALPLSNTLRRLGLQWLVTALRKHK